MNRFGRTLVGVLLPALAVSMGDGHQASAQDVVTLYVPAFASDNSNLGLNVATVLGLQVWQTLRKAPSPNPRRLSFGQGLIFWNPASLPEPTHVVAEKEARALNRLAQLVLWGKSYAFGNGVVVQAYLSLPRYHDFRERRPERWTVCILTAKCDVKIEADIPERRYTFEPIVLEREIVDTYSRPDALRLYRTYRGNDAVGMLGPEFTALEHRPDAVKVKSGGVGGWVRLPRLTEQRTEVVDFVGGVIRIFRADWEGARDLFAKVIKNMHTPMHLRIDAHLYRAMAGAQLGLDVESDLAAAEKLNSYARRVVIFRAMSMLATYEGRGRAGRCSLLDRIEKLVTEKNFVLLPDDPWLAQWEALTHLHTELLCNAKPPN
jgi:hypothetical protein